MSKGCKKLFLVMAIFMACSFFVSVKINAINTVSDFLSFEKEVVELNKENAQLEEQNKKDINATSGNENQVETLMDGFVLQRLIVQGNLKNNYGASKVISYKNLHILCYDSPSQTENAYQRLKQDKSLSVFADQINYLSKYSENDYSYSSYDNWGAESIDIGGYREYLLANNVSKQVVVVVLDTGINTSHPLFTNRLLKDSKGKIVGYSYVDSTYKYSYSKLSFDSDDTKKYSFEDDEGHGSHVAGIIAGLTPTNVKILPIKIAGESGTSSHSTMLAAYLRVIDVYSKQHNIAVVNLSFSGAGKNSEDSRDTYNVQCYQPLLDLNILPITSAGNDSEKNDIEGLKAVVVSALKKSGNQVVFDHSYSNYGKIVDISAPGTDIKSAAIASNNGASSDYVVNSGTSMAAPQVSAVAALLYLDPKFGVNVSAIEIEEKLYEYSIDLGEPNKDELYGVGMLNLKYFDTVFSDKEISFYENDSFVSSYKEHENFDKAFNLRMSINDSNFKIIYTTDKTMPTLNNHIDYTTTLRVDDSIFIYAMGVKVVNGQIVERTKMYEISYFYTLTPIEECFVMLYRGRLEEYLCNYKTLIIPEKINGQVVKELGTNLFAYTEIESITLPETVTTIAGYTFMKATKLKYIYAPGVTKVYLSAFSNADSLRFVTDEHSKSTDKEGAFFPVLNETVGYTFANCDNLEYVKLNSLTTVGDRGRDFANCPKLKSVELNAITSIEESMFYGCVSLTGEFYISENIQNVKSGAFSKTKINHFVVDNKNKYLYTDGLGLYDKKAIIAYAAGNEYLDYEILSSVRINGNNYTITSMEKSALNGAKFNKLIIPYSINYIGPWAAGDSYIYHLVYNAKSASDEGYYSVDENGAGWMSTVFGEISIIEIGEGVEKLPYGLFLNVYFKNVIINSTRTYFEKSSLRRTATDDGNLEKLILNIDGILSETFLKNLFEDSYIDIGSHIEYLYVKRHFNDEKVIELNRSTYYYRLQEGEFFVYTLYSYNPDKKFNIDSSSQGKGFISPNGIWRLKQGESKLYMFVPNKGYYVSKIIIDGIPLSGDEFDRAVEDGYEFKDVDRNHTIHVEFDVIQYTITYKNRDNATLGLLEPKTYIYGQGATLPLIGDSSNVGGWYTTIDCSGKVVTSIKKFETGDKVFYTCISCIFMNIEITGEGKVRSDYESMFIKEGEDIRFFFEADKSSTLKAIIIDGVYLNEYELDSALKYGYLFKNITKSHSIKVIFEKKKYTINAVLEGEGELTPRGNIVVEYGDNQTFSISITREYYIENIYIGSRALSREEINEVLIKGYTFTNVTDNNSIRVIVIENTCIITVIQEGEGEIITSGANKVIRGEDKHYDFKVSESHFIQAIIVDGVSLSESELLVAINEGYTFKNINEDHTFKVIFVKKTFTIEVIVNSCVDMNPKENVIVEYGGSQTFIIKETSGCQINYIYIGEISQSKDKIAKILAEGYTFENVTKDEKIRVVARASVYTITASVEGKGLITPNGESQVFHGNDYTYRFYPYNGYMVSDIIVDNIYLDDVDLDNAIRNGYVFKSIEDNHTIKVLFEKKKYIINASFEGYGYIYPKGDIVLEYGESQMFEIVASEGYYIKNIFVGSRSLREDEIEYILKNGYLLEEVSKDVNIRAITGKLYSIKTNIVGKGEVTPGNSISVKENGDTKLSFHADNGYDIKNIVIDGESLNEEQLMDAISNGYEFKNVNKNHVVQVVFVKNIFSVGVEIIGKGKYTSTKNLSAVECLEDVVITVIPDNGYMISYVEMDNTKINMSGNDIVINKVTSDHQIKIVLTEQDTGMGCSKNGSSKLTGAYDLLFIVFTLMGLAGYKKKFIR